MATHTARDRARAALASLAEGKPDSDSFRHEAVAIMRRAVGVDGWGWLLADPGVRLPTNNYGENLVVDQALRRFFRIAPQAWNEPGVPADRPLRQGHANGAPPVTTLSAATGGDLRRDLSWREVLGPGGVGDKMLVRLISNGTCWAMLHLHRDGSSKHYSEADIEFAADVAPLMAPRVRADLRTPVTGNGALAPEPGTIILDQDLSLVAATPQAWQWLDRLSISGPNYAEPLPGTIYAAATHVAASPEQRPIRVRLRAADGRWVVIRVAPLTTGSQAAAGYAVTLEAAPAQDLAPLLMRAWGLTRREREVAQLVIEERTSEDIAIALFISVHTVRDHLKAIFGKTGVRRRPDLVAALTGRTSPVCDVP